MQAQVADDRETRAPETGWSSRFFGRSGPAAQLATLVVPLLVWLAPLGIGLQAHGALTILSFMLLAWMTEALDFTLAGLVGCFLFWVTGIATMEQAFSGFVDTTAWFLFAAVVIGLIADKTLDEGPDLALGLGAA